MSYLREFVDRATLSDQYEDDYIMDEDPEYEYEYEYEYTYEYNYVYRYEYF